MNSKIYVFLGISHKVEQIFYFLFKHGFIQSSLFSQIYHGEEQSLYLKLRPMFNNFSLTSTSLSYSKSIYISSEYYNLFSSGYCQHFLVQVVLQYYHGNVMFLLAIYKHGQLKRLKNKNVFQRIRKYTRLNNTFLKTSISYSRKDFYGKWETLAKCKMEAKVNRYNKSWVTNFTTSPFMKLYHLSYLK